MPSRGSHSPVDEVLGYPQYTTERQHSPPQFFSWPDRQASQSFEHIPQAIHQDPDAGMIYQQSGEAEMDFSMNHFVSAVSGVSQAYPGVMDHTRTQTMPPTQPIYPSWTGAYGPNAYTPHQYHNWPYQHY
jgi:hypothetical protein